MQLQHLKNILEEVENQLGERKKDEAFLNSQNWLPRVLQKFLVLEQDIVNNGSSSVELTIDEQAKIIRIILKNIPTEKAERFFRICGLNKNQLVSLKKYFQDHNELTAPAFATIMNLKLLSADTAYQQKSSVKNIIPATPSDTNHAFNRLLGKARNVFLSSDSAKVQQLIDALHLPNWYTHPLFDDPEILYVALTACKEARITSIQYATLTQWTEMKTRYGKENVSIFPLLDANGQLTDAAYLYFLNYWVGTPFEDINGHIFITKEQVGQFQLAISNLPFSEQVVIRLSADRIKSGYNADIDINVKAKLAVFQDEKGLGAISTGAYEAFVHTAFPDSAFTLEPRLGVVTKNEVEENTRQFKRVLSVYYSHPPGIKSDNPRFFHTIERKGVVWIAYHDFPHSLLASYIPNAFHPIVLQSVDTIRQALSIQWSNEIWQMIDYDFSIVGKHRDNTSAMLIELLNFNYHEGKYSPEIGALVLDVFFYPEKWKKYSIDFTSLHTSVKNLKYSQNANFSYFNFMNVAHLKKEDPILFSLFKLAAISDAKENSVSVSKIKHLLQEIEAKKDDILPRLSLDKVITRNYLRIVQRTLRLCWDGNKESIEKFIARLDAEKKTINRPSF